MHQIHKCTSSEVGTRSKPTNQTLCISQESQKRDLIVGSLRIFNYESDYRMNQCLSQFNELTFHNPSLARIRNSAYSSMISSATSGSELRCSFKLRSPKALATASLPSTRGTSPEIIRNTIFHTLCRAHTQCSTIDFQNCKSQSQVAHRITYHDLHYKQLDTILFMI